MTMTRGEVLGYDEQDDRARFADLSDRALPAFRSGAERGDYGELPESLQSALRLRATLTDASRNLPSHTQLSSISTELIDALAAGESLDEALSRAVIAHEEVEWAKTAGHILSSALNRTEQVLRDAIRDALPELLAALRTRLEVCVSSLRSAYDQAGDLDIQRPDPLAVAQAGKARQQSLVTIAEQTREYRRIRAAQRDALAASSLPVIGNDGFSVGGWAKLFDTGIHEFKAPGIEGHPGLDPADPKRRRFLPARIAVRLSVMRADVWLPDPDELEQAYASMLSAHAEIRRQGALDEALRAEANAEANRGLSPANRAYYDAIVHNGGIAR